MALGGSTTYTQKVVDNAKTFTAFPDEYLRQRGLENIEVINTGVEGNNSWESLINLQFRVLELEPDLIIIYHVTNDVHARFVEPKAYRSDNSGRRQRWVPEQVPLLAKISFLYRIVGKRIGFFQVSRGLGSRVDATTSQSFRSHGHSPSERMETLERNPPIFFRRNLKSMVAIARAHDASVLLATWAHNPLFDDYASTDYYQRGFREMNRVIRSVAQADGVPLFDFAQAMPKNKKYWGDGRHVNELGAAEKARLFADFIVGRGLLSRSNQLSASKP